MPVPRIARSQLGLAVGAAFGQRASEPAGHDARGSAMPMNMPGRRRAKDFTSSSSDSGSRFSSHEATPFTRVDACRMRSVARPGFGHGGARCQRTQLVAR